MTKYAVYKEMNCEFSIKDFSDATNITENDIIDAYLNSTVNYPECIGRFDTIEEAKKAFDSIQVTTSKIQGWISPLLIADIVLMEEENWEVDEHGDEDFICGDNLNAKAAPYIEEAEEAEEAEEEEDE